MSTQKTEPQAAVTTLDEIAGNTGFNADQTWVISERLELLLRRLRGSYAEPAVAADECVPQHDGVLGVVEVGIVRTRQALRSVEGLLTRLEQHI